MTPIDHVYAAFTDAPWLRRNTLLMTKVGSHAYNLAGPDSDVDLTGVAYPEPEMVLGLQSSFQQRSTKAPNPDATIFELRKFLSCALDGNPAFLDPFFCRDEEVISSETTFAGYNLRKLRYAFASQKMTMDNLLRFMRDTRFDFGKAVASSPEQQRAMVQECETPWKSSLPIPADKGCSQGASTESPIPEVP